MKPGEKYPRDIIERFDKFEKMCNIEEISISVFKDSNYSRDNKIRVIGEVIGDKLPYDILMVITVHNELGEVIGTNFSEGIESKCFSGIHSFSRDVIIACDETISKIKIYPVKNPNVWE